MTWSHTEPCFNHAYTDYSLCNSGHLALWESDFSSEKLNNNHRKVLIKCWIPSSSPIFGVALTTSTSGARFSSPSALCNNSQWLKMYILISFLDSLSHTSWISWNSMTCYLRQTELSPHDLSFSSCQRSRSLILNSLILKVHLPLPTLYPSC